MIVEFEMAYLRELYYLFGIEVWQKEHGIFMSQAKYTWDILKKFIMLSCKPVETPLEIQLKLYTHDDQFSRCYFGSSIGCKFHPLYYNSTIYFLCSHFGIKICGKTQGVALENSLEDFKISMWYSWLWFGI